MPEQGAASDNRPLIEALAYQRFVESFLEQSGRSQLRLVLAAAALAYLWARNGAWLGPVLWFPLMAAFLLWRHYKTPALVAHQDPRHATQRIAWLLAVTGVLLSVPVLGLAEMDDFSRATLTLTLLVVATVSVVNTSGFRRVYMVFAAPQVVSVALGWAWLAAAQGRVEYGVLSVLVCVYLTFLVGMGKHANVVFMQACEYRLGEQQRNSELQVALDAAAQANQAKTQFLAAASHDLRQPIHSMNVLVAALSLRPLDEASTEIVTLLGNVNQLLSKQLDTLLDVSKLDAGIVRAEMAPHRLDLMVKAHHAMLRASASQRGVKLEVKSDADVWVNTDAALLSRALSNLTDNAIKYTPPNGVVAIVLQRVENNALLAVTDSGIGIAPEEQERVFREFYQVGNNERDRDKGLGLGLSIVKRLCALLGVQVSLRSALGMGTTVGLRMPLCKAVAHSVAELETPLQRELTVLVVDDELMVRESMRLLLQSLGCTVVLADSVAQAEAAAQAGRLDLVLCDMRLRGSEQGLDAVQAVRRHQPTVSAVLVTGDTAPHRLREARDAGLPLLFKPATLNELVALLPRAAVAQAQDAKGLTPQEQQAL